MVHYHSASGSVAEDLFIDLFSDTFGAEKAGYLYSQYPFFDIYQNARFADFVLESGAKRVAIEIDDEASHNPRLVSQDKFYDDLLKQNSMIYQGWDVYRWAVRQMQLQPEAVKDELLTDYKVLILAVDEKDMRDLRLADRDGDGEIDSVDQLAKIVGTWKGLNKQIYKEDERVSRQRSGADALSRCVLVHHRGLQVVHGTVQRRH